MVCPKCKGQVPAGAIQCPSCGVKFKTKLCPHCKSEILFSATVCPRCRKPVGPTAGQVQQAAAPAKEKRGSFRWWRIPIYIVIFAIGIGVGSVYTRYSILSNVKSAFSQFSSSSSSSSNTESTTTPPVKSETSSQSQTSEPSADIPKEYSNALNKAEIYSSAMHMSKQGIYDQLTSEVADKFSAEAAQYAIDNLKADYKENALEKAKTYYNNMNMSKEAIREQLVSEYGEKFTEEEADYAVQNLE